MTETRKKLILEDVNLLFRNFAGKEGPYNREGDRSFNIALPAESADELEQEGWKVRWLDSREDEEPLPILEVAVNFRGRPPKIVMVGSVSKKKTALDEESVDILDYADIVSADVICNPYHWTVNGKSGVKAYAETIYVTIHENELDLKYSDLDEDG